MTMMQFKVVLGLALCLAAFWASLFMPITYLFLVIPPLLLTGFVLVRFP